MIRIIGGELRSRKILTPKGEATRPSSDFVRESVFNICQGLLPGCRFLDLFAGSGAIGIEALSRGAAQATFVEKGSRALAVLKKNLRDLDLLERSQVLPLEALRALANLATHGTKFDIIYADPPYFDPKKGMREPWSHQVLALVDELDLLQDHGQLFLEDCKEAGDPGINLKNIVFHRSRSFGRTCVWQFHKR